MSDSALSQQKKPFLLHQYNKFDVCEADWDTLGLEMQEKINAFRLTAFGGYTGQQQDIDQYDPIYRHIYIIDRQTGDLLAYYRMGLTQTMRALGYDKLYISSLYKIDPTFFEKNPNSAEMGRLILDQSTTQMQYLLPLVWKSLYVFAKRYQLTFFYGMVTISSKFQQSSVKKMVGFMKKHANDSEKEPYFEAKYPLVLTEQDIASAPDTVPELQAAVREIEGEDGPQVPVMYRAYMSYAGAKYLAAGYDPDFDNSLDIIITGHPYQDIIQQIINKF